MIHLKMKAEESVKNLYGERKNWADDLGFDLFIPEDIILQPGHNVIDHKVAIQAENEFSDWVGYLLLPRSSFSKFNCILLNSVGVIDPAYRGNIKAVVFNLTQEPIEIKKGDRLFQLVFPKFSNFNSFEFSDELSETERGKGGFGSTGS